MFTENLFTETLIKPVVEGGARELFVISGYATPAMVSYHTEKIKEETDGESIKINIIVGMTVRDGIPWVTHSGFKNLMSDLFECRYIIKGLPVHTKAYLWKDIDKAFIGSANYTQTAFCGKSREALTIIDPKEIYTYYDILLADTLPCNQTDILDKIRITKRGLRPELQGPKEEEIITEPETAVINTEGLEKATLSLVDGNQQVPERSGLNWGQRSGRDHNQAYIAIRQGECPTEFFPPRYRHFTVLTDDGITLHCVRAQERGKAIHTSDNAELGRYFRKRLSVSLGEKVETRNLTAYGRTDVDFYKLDEETYYMDFSV